MASIEELLERGRRELARAPFGPSPREAALLLGRILDLGEAQVLSRGERPVGPEEEARFAALLDRRLQGEPVAYLLGEREFYGRSFFVDRRVLIPRPETEHLVEAALELELPPTPRILDLGTGSGCLAVTLALELDGRAVAVDLSPGALVLARRNVARHALASRVLLLGSDLAGALELGSFDLVVSNPPYIDPAERPELSPEITGFEPSEALFAADRGEAILGRLFAELGGLRHGVPLVVEMGHLHESIVDELTAVSPFALERILPDYAGKPRIAVSRRR